MIYISVQDTVSQLNTLKAQLGETQFSKAISRSLNETILQGRTEARKAVKSIYNIPQKNLDGINVNKSTRVKLFSELFASTQPIPMDAFAPKFVTGTQSISISKKGSQKVRTFKNKKSNPTAGVSIEVIKGQRVTIPYAFLIAGGKPRVFARGEYQSGTSYGFIQRHKRITNDGNDLPIKPLLSITVHAAVINDESLKNIDEKVSAVFPVSIMRNINFLLNGKEA